jgi:hypothetical protein
MKKAICLFTALLLLCMMALPVAAASEKPKIVLQPQNSQYPQYSTALYRVKATGTNLKCTWYIEFQGQSYDMSVYSENPAPWENFAGEQYGTYQEDANTFVFYFGGILEGLNGAKIWCVIEDGHDDVTSEKALITVGAPALPPEIVSVPWQVTVKKGEETELRCVSKSNDESQLTWIWYETTTGQLQDIKAISEAEQYSDSWTVSTEQPGTRYYVCGVFSSKGGIAYSNVITVTVEEGAPETQPTQPTTVPTEPSTAPATVPTTAPSTAPATVPTTAPSTAPTVPSGTTGTAQGTEPSKGGETAPAVTEPGLDDPSGLSWWIVAAIVLVAAGAGVGTAFLLVRKKS